MAIPVSKVTTRMACLTQALFQSPPSEAVKSATLQRFPKKKNSTLRVSVRPLISRFKSFKVQKGADRFTLVSKLVTRKLCPARRLP